MRATLLEHDLETGPEVSRSLLQLSYPVPYNQELITQTQRHLLSKPGLPRNGSSEGSSRASEGSSSVDGKMESEIISACSTWGPWLKEFSVFGNQTFFFFFLINPKGEDMHRQYLITAPSSHPWQDENKQNASPQAKTKPGSFYTMFAKESLEENKQTKSHPAELGFTPAII